MTPAPTFSALSLAAAKAIGPPKRGKAKSAYDERAVAGALVPYLREAARIALDRGIIHLSEPELGPARVRLADIKTTEFSDKG